MLNHVVTVRLPDAMATQLAEIVRKTDASESYVLSNLLREPLARAVEAVSSPEDALRLQKLASTPRAANA